MIYGIGTDIVTIARMQQMIDEHGEKFARRVLADEEFEQFKQAAKPAAFLAKRFAAKEAASKALGTGFRDGLSLKHIYVTNDDLGKPQLNFVKRGRELIENFAINQSHVSIADERDYAVAFVTLSCE